MSPMQCLRMASTDEKYRSIFDSTSLLVSTGPRPRACVTCKLATLHWNILTRPGVLRHTPSLDQTPRLGRHRLGSLAPVLLRSYITMDCDLSAKLCRGHDQPRGRVSSAGSSVHSQCLSRSRSSKPSQGLRRECFTI